MQENENIEDFRMKIRKLEVELRNQRELSEQRIQQIQTKYDDLKSKLSTSKIAYRELLAGISELGNANQISFLKKAREDLFSLKKENENESSTFGDQMTGIINIVSQICIAFERVSIGAVPKLFSPDTLRKSRPNSIEGETKLNLCQRCLTDLEENLKEMPQANYLLSERSKNSSKNLMSQFDNLENNPQETSNSPTNETAQYPVTSKLSRQEAKKFNQMSISQSYRTSKHYDNGKEVVEGYSLSVFPSTLNIPPSPTSEKGKENNKEGYREKVESSPSLNKDFDDLNSIVSKDSNKDVIVRSLSSSGNDSKQNTLEKAITLEGLIPQFSKSIKIPSLLISKQGTLDTSINTIEVGAARFGMNSDKSKSDSIFQNQSMRSNSLLVCSLDAEKIAELKEKYAHYLNSRQSFGQKDPSEKILPILEDSKFEESVLDFESYVKNLSNCDAFNPLIQNAIDLNSQVDGTSQQPLKYKEEFPANSLNNNTLKIQPNLKREWSEDNKSDGMTELMAELEKVSSISKLSQNSRIPRLSNKASDESLGEAKNLTVLAYQPSDSEMIKAESTQEIKLQLYTPYFSNDNSKKPVCSMESSIVNNQADIKNFEGKTSHVNYLRSDIPNNQNQKLFSFTDTTLIKAEGEPIHTSPASLPKFSSQPFCFSEESEVMERRENKWEESNGVFQMSDEISAKKKRPISACKEFDESSRSFSRFALTATFSEQPDNLTSYFFSDDPSDESSRVHFNKCVKDNGEFPVIKSSKRQREVEKPLSSRIRTKLGNDENAEPSRLFSRETSLKKQKNGSFNNHKPTIKNDKTLFVKSGSKEPRLPSRNLDRKSSVSSVNSNHREVNSLNKVFKKPEKHKETQYPFLLKKEMISMSQVSAYFSGQEN